MVFCTALFPVLLGCYSTALFLKDNLLPALLLFGATANVIQIPRQKMTLRIQNHFNDSVEQ